MCFENSVFQYLVTWGSTSGGPSKEVRTSANSITMATSTRQMYTIKIIAVGKDGTNEHQSEEVLVQVTAGVCVCVCVSVCVCVFMCVLWCMCICMYMCV